MKFNFNKDNDVKAQYKNTRSKFYHKPQSFDAEQFKQQANSSQNTGGFWKEKGNEYFKGKNYDKAIQCYSKAIEINSGESQYYSNRSKCYQKQGNLALALKDAEVACELDQGNVKAHYICGCILGELGKNDDSKLVKAENRLKKALRLCTTVATQEYSQEISIKMFRLRKLIWLKDVQRQTNSLQAEKQIIRRCYDSYGISKAQYQMINSSLQSRLQKLKEPREIPDHLICKITLQLMEDPVVSQAGFTYERKALEEHYKLKGPIQPINRKECKGFIIANHAIKITIQQFLNDHPWSFQYREKEDYRLIVMI